MDHFFAPPVRVNYFELLWKIQAQGVIYSYTSLFTFVRICVGEQKFLFWIILYSYL